MSQPNKMQEELIDIVCGLVNMVLSRWPRQSGKSWVRQELARRIIEDDVDKDDYNPYQNYL